MIKQVLQNAKTQLSAAGVESAKLDAMILLEFVLNKDRSFLIANSEHKITEKQKSEFEKLLKRRLKREPIAHIIGKKEFYGREFKVSKEVLSPRPETEFLIEAALKRYSKTEALNILDIGTGSGCILLTLLLELPNSTGTGLDISTNALAIARENAYNLKVSSALFIESNWLEKLDKQQKFNLIVSNPPYIPRPLQKSLEAELEFEPEMALFSGDEGLDSYREIARNLKDLDFDFAILEIGINQEQEIEKIFGECQMESQIKLIETIKDLAGINRVLVFAKVR